MLLWVVSDLHLELTRGWDLPSGGARPQFDLLVVAGDLMAGGHFEPEGLTLIALDQLGVAPLTITAADIKREAALRERKCRLGVPAAPSRYRDVACKS
jgi:hypothetical protein